MWIVIRIFFANLLCYNVFCHKYHMEAFSADSCKERHTILMTWNTTPAVGKSDVHCRTFMVAVVWDSVSAELWLLTGFIVHTPTCQMTDEWIRGCSWIILAGGRGGSTGRKVRSAPLSQQQFPIQNLWLNSATKRLVYDTNKETNN